MSLNLESNNTAAKFTLNTSKLKQGIKINLSKDNPNLLRAAVKISWVGDDLDICAVGKDKDGSALLRPTQVMYKGRKEIVPQDLIYYMNLQQNGIKHGGDVVSSSEEEVEQINISVVDLDNEIFGIDFAVTSHVESGSPLTFDAVRKLKAELVDLDTNEVLYTTDLSTENLNGQTGAIFASIFREGLDWSYSTGTVGIGKEPQGVQNILTKYYS